MPFFLYSSFLSVFTPIQQSTALATIVMRRSLLPGVTTLFRDLDRRPILGASNHYYLCYYCMESFIAGVRKHMKTFHRLLLKQVQ